MASSVSLTSSSPAARAESGPSMRTSSLRQRTGGAPDRGGGSIDTDSGGASSTSKPTSSQTPHKRSRFRINKLLGRIVPIIILVYIGYAYDLAVFRYHYGYVYKVLKRPGLVLAYSIPAHVGFLFAVRAHLQVFLTHSDSSSRRHGLSTLLGKRFRPHDAAMLTDGAGRDEIVACQADGQPLRCWRDDCGGRIRAARTRHCGDCGTCRVGFDHHCAWFDDDITAPSTLQPFIHFLLAIPPLFGWVFAPLLPLAWRHTRQIWRLACADPSIEAQWWSRKLTWVGGPMFRYAVGWGWAGWKASHHQPKVVSGTMEKASLRLPLVTGFGFIFSGIALFLAYSTLSQLSHGILTIDVERAKAYRSLTSSTVVGPLARARLNSLDPRVFFSVPTSLFDATTDGREVVAMNPEQGLWRGEGGRWSNIRFFLDDNAHRQMQGHWPLSDTIRRRIVQRAEEQYHLRVSRQM